MNHTLKEKAVSFLQMIVLGKNSEAYERYIGSDFRHHNPFFPGDAKSLLHAMQEEAVENLHIKILRLNMLLERETWLWFTFI